MKENSIRFIIDDDLAARVRTLPRGIKLSQYLRRLLSLALTEIEKDPSVLPDQLQIVRKTKR